MFGLFVLVPFVMLNDCPYVPVMPDGFVKEIFLYSRLRLRANSIAYFVPIVKELLEAPLIRSPIFTIIRSAS